MREVDAFQARFEALLAPGKKPDVKQWIQDLSCARKELFAVESQKAGERGPVYLRSLCDPSRELLVTPEFHKDGWRITTFTDKLPSGHVCFEDRTNALRSALGLSSSGETVGSVHFRVRPLSEVPTPSG
ncbi:MAG: hypothetical protein H6827_09685 [Planctomycetes bacterium]|nr:hypothetical protein [Planctomycetota bacterium]